MKRDDVQIMLGRAESGGQHLQRRCFVISSFRNKELVSTAVKRLQSHGLFVYDFTVAEFSFSESDWGSTSLSDAHNNPEISGAAQSDLTMLNCLGAPDIALVILPCGFSGGWEAGYAASRGANLVVCSGGSQQVDVPLLHADKIVETLDDAINYIEQLIQGH